MVPDAISCLGVTFPNAFVVPHSNQTVVAPPLGLTLPARVAPSPCRLVAACVVATGFETVLESKLTLKVSAQFPGPIKQWGAHPFNEASIAVMVGVTPGEPPERYTRS